MHVSTNIPLTTLLLLSLVAAAPAPANRLQRRHFASGKPIDALALAALGRRNPQVPHQPAYRPKEQPHQARQDSGSDIGGDGGTSSPSDFAGIGNDGDSGNNDNNNNLFNFGDTFAGQPSYADSGSVKRNVPDVENRLGRVRQRKRQADDSPVYVPYDPDTLFPIRQKKRQDNTGSKSWEMDPPDMFDSEAAEQANMLSGSVVPIPDTRKQRKRQAQQVQDSNTAQQDPDIAAAQADATNDFEPATPPMSSDEQAIANAIEAPIQAADNQNKRKQRKQRK